MPNSQSKTQKDCQKSPRVYLVPLYFQVGKKRKLGGKAIVSSEPILHVNDNPDAKIKSYWGDRLIGLVIKEGEPSLRTISLSQFADDASLPFEYVSVMDELGDIESGKVSTTTKVIITWDDCWVNWAYGGKLAS